MGRVIGRGSHEARRLGDRFAALLAVGAREAGPLVGIEHEYQVLMPEGRLDFSEIVHSLGLGEPLLDPGDLDAYRLRTGTVVTSDDAEAEIVSPPVRVGPGFAAATMAFVRDGRAALTARLPPHARLRGFSTHLNVELSDRDEAETIGRMYASTFAPALMLLLDDRSSPGLLVRPRPGRLELGGEFADGARLMVALTFAAGSVLALRRAVADGVPPVPPLVVSVDPDDHRFGWFVDRSAFGPDLYGEGRAAELRTLAGAKTTGQAQLEAAWTAARSALAPLVDAGDLAPVDAAVSGDRPLPCEDDGSSGLASPARTVSSPFGDVMVARSRPGYGLAPVMATWDTTILIALADGSRRRAFVSVPRENLETFLRQLDSGALDEVILSFLAHPGRARLRRHAEARRPGLYARIGPRRRLLSPEKGPARR